MKLKVSWPVFIFWVFVLCFTASSCASEIVLSDMQLPKAPPIVFEVVEGGPAVSDAERILLSSPDKRTITLALAPGQKFLDLSYTETPKGHSTRYVAVTRPMEANEVPSVFELSGENCPAIRSGRFVRYFAKNGKVVGWSPVYKIIIVERQAPAKVDEPVLPPKEPPADARKKDA